MTRRLLIVDDEPDIRAIARASLERIGRWVVITAEDGESATALARAEQPDAIILDVMMPGLDGRGTVAALAEDPTSAAIPVVLLTAGTDDIEWSSGTAVVGVLAKPFDPMRLPHEIAALLGWEEETA